MTTQVTIANLKDALTANPFYSSIAIRDTFKGDGKDIVISKATPDKLIKRGYTPIGIGKAFNAGAVSIEDIQFKIDLILSTPNYKIPNKVLNAWKNDPVATYVTTGIEYSVIDTSQPRNTDLGWFGTLGGRSFRPMPLYMDSNGMNVAGAGKLIGFIFGITRKSLIPVK